MSTRFKNEDWDIRYGLHKVVETDSTGRTSLHYLEDITFGPGPRRKYGYTHAIIRRTPPLTNAYRINEWIKRTMAYPEAATKSGIEGYTHVRVWLTSQGRVTSVRFVNSSGNILLDNRSMEMFIGQTLPVNPLQKMPHFIDVTIHYHLIRSHPPAPPS
ncbi:TonB family protein [Acetobacter persici]|uniref:TonB family protein n=1 Tax=Acetobacter persici TaxID=1076596 RepID=UPI0020CECCBF|nr:TonB family protein [Acetobacter persici]MCP9320154.1 TonB family protein [Acetobacter persici]